MVADETCRAMETQRPSVVVADALMPGALIAAEWMGTPRVVLFHMPEYLPGPGRPAAGPGFLPRTDLVGRVRDALMTRLFLQAGRSVPSRVQRGRRPFGLAPLATPQELLGQFHAADLRLILTSRAFDFPITPPPPNVRFVGPVLDDPDWAGEWQNPWPHDDPRPLGGRQLVVHLPEPARRPRRIITALGTLPVRGLVTLGPAMAGERFQVPQRRHGRPRTPRAGVPARVRHCDARGAWHGDARAGERRSAPLPAHGRDQDDNAARVVARGVGLRLRPSSGPSRIGAAVRRLLNEPAFKVRAGELGKIIREDVADDRATKELDEIAER